MKELNLVNDSLSYNFAVNGSIALAKCGKALIIKNNDYREITISIYKLTTIGEEINKLINHSFELLYARKTFDYIKANGNVSGFIADVTSTSKDKLTYSKASIINL